jgi:ubiquinone biosynthesis protein UbiJ
MNVLETLLRPVADIVNRQVRMKTPARELCDELEGRVVAVRLRDTALAVYFLVEAGAIRPAGEFDGEPDVVISGSLPALAKLAARSGEQAVRDGSLELAGDADIAHRFQRLLQYGRPDLEEELAGVVGDSPAHGLGRFARSLGEWGRRARATLEQNVSEYLQEESRAVPSRHEEEAFRRDVETLRDDVERLAARLRRLESPAPDDDSGR